MTRRILPSETACASALYKLQFHCIESKDKVNNPKGKQNWEDALDLISEVIKKTNTMRDDLFDDCGESQYDAVDYNTPDDTPSLDDSFDRHELNV